MDNVFVILLMRDKERVSYIKNIKSLPDTPKFNIYEAEDGKNMGTKEIEYYIDNKYLFHNYWLNRMSNVLFTKGQIGCALSHIKLWEKAIEEKKEYIVIFEDDVKFLKGYNEKFKNVKSELPSDFHFCYLYRHPGHNSLFTDKKLIIPDKKYIQKAPGAWSTVGYIISLEGMKKFISEMKPIFKTIDGMIMKIINDDNSKCYAVKQNLVDTIGNLTSNDSQKLNSNVWNSGYFKVK